MIRLSIVSNPPLDPSIALCDYEDIHFVEVNLTGPDIRAVLNSAPVKRLDPYPLRNDPTYLGRRSQ